MTKKIYSKSNRVRVEQTNKHSHKLSRGIIQPEEFTVKRGVGFRKQINLYWQKRDAEKLRYKKTN